MQRGKRSAGFTLIEVLVALAIGAVVIVGARQLMGALGAHAGTMVGDARATDARMNSEAVARDLVAALSLPAGDTAAFEGDERRARFGSWCTMPTGWQERCEVTLAVEQTGESPRVVLVLSTGEQIILRDSLSSASLRYLVSADVGGRWAGRHGRSIIPPLAVGVIMDRDTLLLRIGDRR